MKVDIRTSAGLPTVYLDVIRNGQTLLTRWLDVKDGKAEQRLDLPPNVFGTLELHAYQMLAAGDIIRDSRVVYVHTPGDLKIDVKADRDEYLPGKEGKIRFQVTNAKGEPTPAALGVIVVDEAVYALQEMQPGLEKVYFTLQEELIKPQAQVVYRPSETIDTLVRRPELAADKQQIAQVLLTAVKPKPPARWEVVPDISAAKTSRGRSSRSASRCTTTPSTTNRASSTTRQPSAGCSRPACSTSWSSAANQRPGPDRSFRQEMDA